MNQAQVASRSSDLGLRRWGEFAMVSMLVMETCWIADWYGVLVRPQASLLSICLFIGLALIGTHFLARVMGQSSLRVAWRRLLFCAWSALVLLAGFLLLVFSSDHLSLLQVAAYLKDAFLVAGTDLKGFWHILIVLLILYHAIRTAHEPLQLYLVQANFQLGLFLLLIYGLAFGWQDPSQALFTTYGFLFFAMSAMSATRISTLSESRGGRLQRLQSPWLWGILAIAGLVVAVAVLIGYLSTNFAADAIAMLVSLLLAILLIAGVVIFSPILLLFLSLEPALRSLLNSLSSMAIFSELLKYINGTAQSLGIDPVLFESVTRTGRPVVLLSILTGFLVLIMASLVWKPWKRRLVEENSASNIPLRAALRFPHFLLRRFSGRLPSKGRLLAAARIRWVYGQFINLCSRLGKPRRPAMTPLEYMPLVSPLFPGEEATLATITQAYLKVRYGELPETYEEVQAVLVDWERLQSQGKLLLKNQKKRFRWPGSGRNSSESG